VLQADLVRIRYGGWHTFWEKGQSGGGLAVLRGRSIADSYRDVMVFRTGLHGIPHGVVRCKPPNPRVGRMRSGCTRPHVRTLLTLFFWLCLHNIRIVARASDHGCHGRYQHVARMCTGNLHVCAGKPVSASRVHSTHVALRPRLLLLLLLLLRG
jgi:hypothetical protein